MRRRKWKRRDKILLLFLLLNCITVSCVGYQWGEDFWTLMKRNVALKFYNGILDVYIPGVVVTESDNRQSLYQDMTAMLFPSFSYHEELLWYDSQLEERVDYENLAVLENEQMEQMIAENGSTGNSGEDAAEVSSESTETVTVEEAVPENVTETLGVSGTSAKQITINREKLKDFDYLRQTFYQVDSSTTIGSDQLNVDKLLGEDMRLSDNSEGPQILIYHTHSQEGYADSIEGDPDTTVVGVGDYLTQLLTEKYGLRVLHHTGTYDVNDRDHAYSNAAPALEQLLAENPSIEVVIDLHRDGVAETTRLVTEQNGKQMAQIMFFNGLSRTTTLGDLTNLKNPYIDQNLAFSFQMQLAAAEYYPGFTRNIYLKGYRYNMHYCPKSLLIEVGAQTNTLEEAKNAMEPLADILAKVLTGTE